MSQEINKTLTGAMGLCWHLPESSKTLNNSYRNVCVKCKQLSGAKNNYLINPNFFTWEGFGILKEYFMDNAVIYEVRLRGCRVTIVFDDKDFTTITSATNDIPRAFAEILYNFLKEKE